MKKKAASILAAVLTAALFTGCGQSKEENALRDLDADNYVTLDRKSVV